MANELNTRDYLNIAIEELRLEIIYNSTAGPDSEKGKALRIAIEELTKIYDNMVEPNKEEDKKPEPNWSGIWIDRRDAIIEFDDRLSDYREYTNDYEKGKYDAFVEAEDVITSLEGHD